VTDKSQDWYEDDSEQEEAEDYPIDQYDLTASPNDFNVSTLYSFIESGAVKIPGFQRHYVWDQKRASKLIESLIIGLPVPQIFLYEEARNSFLVIDGQQRLMSIYYFVKQRFPKKDKRVELRRIFEEHGSIPDDVLHNDEYFVKFNLHLPPQLPAQPNRFHRLNYSTLGDYKTSFDLRPIRNIIVKQVSPKDDDSAIYEIFNRLNSGGVNLTAQEIRMSLYHSRFYGMLARANLCEEWRRILSLADPDLHVKDIEFLLRAFAMLEAGSQYTPSMIKFLNSYSKKARDFGADHVDYLEGLFRSFLASCARLSPESFQSANSRFSVTIFESVFAAVCRDAYEARAPVQGEVTPESIAELRADPAFREAAERRTTNRRNVEVRLGRARELVKLG
jgi:hypothetical protein